MMKIILIISIFFFIASTEKESHRILSEYFQNFSIQESMAYLVKDENFKANANSECLGTLMKYVNNFETYSTELGLMTFYSGRDLNDVGRFDDCRALDFTRYIVLSVSGLPIGVYLGICGPKECTEEDFNPLSIKLASLAKIIESSLPDAEALKVDWKADNFQFRDSAARNAENTSIILTFLVFAAFFVFIVF